MKIFFISISLVLISLNLFGQNCTILSKANNITPDKLCSPVTAIWNVSYTGVNNAGTPVSIRYDWNNGVIQTIPAVQIGPGVFQATAANTYTSSGSVCNYHPQATLIVNGVLCSSSTQEQIVTVWDDDDHNGGHMHISPTVYPICVGNSANVRFQDLTQFNCVPPQENDNPNVNTRWLQWIYGTDITMTGTPVTINGILRPFPYRDNVITLLGPVTGSGVWSEIMNVANDKLVGQYFQVTLRNWNYCNPYDDPTIPGPPADLVNGDHPPVVTTAIILIVSDPDATITPVGNLCVNGNPVTLSAHDPGGIWSGPGVAGDTFNPTIAGVGNHTIRYDISNASGCTDFDEITIIVVPKPDATITSVDTLCVNSPIITLSAIDPGGIWSGPGVAGNTFNPTVAGVGNHIIRYDITNANGCHDFDELTVTVLPLPDATITPIGNLCVDVSPVNLSAHDPGGIWSGPGVIGNIFNPATAGVGNHLINYSIVNTYGCNDNDQITVTVMPKPDATITPVGTLCVNSPIITLSSHDSGGIWSGPGVAGNTFNPAIAGVGNHIIRYDITNASGCSDNNQITITVVPKPDATITPVSNLCVNANSVTLSAHDPGGIWSGPGVIGNIFNPAVAGVGNHLINYNIVDANGCSDNNQITVTVMPKPDATITPVGIICINSPIITLSSHDSGGIWSGPGVAGNTFNPAGAGVGNHIIRYDITNASGCSDNNQITITVVPKPDATITPVGNLCVNVNPVTLSAHDPGGIYSGPGVAGNTFNPTIAGVGNHLIRYDITDANGCKDFNQITVTVMPKPDATITPVDTLCVQSNPVTLTAHDYGGTWSGTGVISDIFDPRLSGVGNHFIRYDITKANGCKDFDQITVTVMPLLPTNINPVGTLYINSPPVGLTASPPGGTWTGNGVINNMFDPGSAGLGNHIVTYQTLVDKWGCRGIDTIHIKVIMPPLPVADFEPDTVGCSPLFVQFRNMSLAGESYLWEFGDKTYSTEKNPFHIYYIPGNYIVKLTVYNIAGKSTHVGLTKVYQNPTAIFDAYPTNIVNNEQVVVFYNNSYYDSLHLWRFGDGQTSDEKNPYHKYLTAGNYNVSLLITSKDGCIDSTILNTPIIVDWKIGAIKFPNVFKWNESGPTGGQWKEGVNPEMDFVFRPFFENVIEYKLQIFNRWGVLIYESYDLYKGWDGYSADGNLALQGVYVWRVKGRFADGKYFVKVGDVTFLH